MTTLTPQQLQNAQNIGASGGTVPTTGMHANDKAAIDAAVRKGQQGGK